MTDHRAWTFRLASDLSTEDGVSEVAISGRVPAPAEIMVEGDRYSVLDATYDADSGVSRCVVVRCP